MRAIIDVGANRGQFTTPVALRNPQLHLFAIEPVPELSSALIAQSSHKNLDNITVITSAVSHKTGTVKLNVARHKDWGLTSLLDFRSEVKVNPFWKEVDDLFFEDSINVHCAPLSELLAGYEIESIDFLKIDTQGFDLIALNSLGSALIGKVKAGMLEVASCRSTSLYESSPTLRDALNTLDGLGFEIYQIKPNDGACCEVNVFFRRTDVHIEEHVLALGLNEIDAYAGLDFWHYPTKTQTPPLLLTWLGLYTKIYRMVLKLIRR